MKKKNGFTLIELVGVMIVISLVSLLVVPGLLKLIRDSKESLSDRQKELLVDAARKWVVEKGADLMSKDPTFITMGDLADGGYITSSEVADLSQTAKNFEGCIMVTYSYKTEGFNYTFLDECNKEDYINNINLDYAYDGGWIKRLSMTFNTSFNASDEKTFIRYCATDSDTCKPNTEIRKQSETITISTQGSNVHVCAVSVSESGSQSETKCVGPFKIDNTPPQLDIPPDERLDSTVDVYDFSLGVIARDNITPPDEISVTRSGDIALTVLGTYVLTYTATDLAGNTVYKSRKVVVTDATPPTIGLSVKNDQFNAKKWAKNNITVDLALNDIGGSGLVSYTYCTTTSESGICSPNRTVTDLSKKITIDTESRTNYVCAYSTDGADNNSATSCIGPYMLDKTGPNIGFVDNKEISITVDSIDVSSDVSYHDNLTSDDKLVVASPVGNVVLGVVGDHTITYSATDEANNTKTISRTYHVVDDVPPTVSFSAPSPDGNNSWYKNNFDVTINTADFGGEVTTIKYCTTTGTSCTPNREVSAKTKTVGISTESRTNKVCAYAIDNYSNAGTSKCSSNYKLDKTAPDASFTNPLSIGTSVTTRGLEVDVTYTDNLSSAANITTTASGNVTWGIAGSYSATYTMTDEAGNSKSLTREINVFDDEAPSISLTVKGSPFNANGWANNNIDIDITTSDNEGILGYKVCKTASATGRCTSTDLIEATTGTITIDTESKTNYVCGLAVDTSHNEGTLSCVGPYMLDKTGPSITFDTDNIRVGLRKTSVDATSGVNYDDNFSMESEITKGTPVNNITFGTVGDYTIVYSATDAAGNSTSESRHYNVVDDIAPVASITVPAANGSNGWYNSAFDVTVSGTDEGGTVASIKVCTTTARSGVCTPSDAQDGATRNVTINTASKTNYVCAIVTDNHSNPSERKCAGPLMFDKTGPTITVPADTTIDTAVTTYDITTGVSASDNLTAISDITWNNSSNIVLGVEGEYTITHRATDLAGNTSTKTRKLTIVSADEPGTTPSRCFTYTAAGQITGYDETCTKDVIIPSYIKGTSITSIGNLAFFNKGLTSVVLPNTVSAIGDQAFFTNAITEVTMPEGLKTIGEWVFASNQLVKVDLPTTIESLGLFSFANNKIKIVNLPGKDFDLGNRSFTENEIEHLHLPEGITKIAYGTFYQNKIYDLTLPESLVEIDKNGFAGNQLTEVTIPKNVTTINDSALWDNTPMTKIINKTGRSFDWWKICAGSTSEKPEYTFVTGTLTVDSRNIQVTAS